MLCYLKKSLYFLPIYKKFKKRLNFKNKSAIMLLSLRNDSKKVGVDDAEGTPVPIPNTEVKLSGVENT